MIPGPPLALWPSADGAAIYLTLAGSGKLARLDLESSAIDPELDLGRVDGIGLAGPP